MDYQERSLERKFLTLSQHFKVMLVTGARQVGKTTMLRHLAEGSGRSFVSLDDPATRQLAQADPRLFLDMYSPPVLIDEVQYAPQLFPLIKLTVDRSDDPGQIWLTGSQHYLMMRNVKESLAGRVGLLHMFGFGQSERRGHADSSVLDFSFPAWRERAAAASHQSSAADIFQSIWYGALPAVAGAAPEVRTAILSSYVDTYLLRDAADFGGVHKLVEFRQFLAACAGLVGQQLNYAKLRDTVGITHATARAWIELLEGMGVLYMLRPYSNNALSRLAKMPKLYFTDTGLASFLAQWASPDALMNGPQSGAMLENHVVMEFVHRASVVPAQWRLSYLRNSNGSEIDLILEDGIKTHPFEVRKSASPDTRSLRRFDILNRADVQRGAGGIICLREDPLPVTATDSLIPAQLL